MRVFKETDSVNPQTLLTAQEIKELLCDYLTNLSKKLITKDISLLQPKPWEYVRKSTENYTGITEKNQKKLDVALLEKSNSDKHEYILENTYHPKGLDSTNILQSTPNVLQQEVYDWLFSENNRDIISEEQFELLKKEYDKANRQKRTAATVEYMKTLQVNLSEYYNLSPPLGLKI